MCEETARFLARNIQCFEIQRMEFHYIPIMAAGTGSTKNNITVERGDLRMVQANTAATALDEPDDTENNMRLSIKRQHHSNTNESSSVVSRHSPAAEA